MIPKYRAYDSGSLCRMYRPEEVWVGDGGVWVVDEDSWDGELILNNDLNLMQSTGLFDKNGKEIFEGDILGIKTDEENAKVEVSWDDKHALFAFESKKHDVKGPLCELFEGISYPLKIIGNIYENPELEGVKQ